MTPLPKRENTTSILVERLAAEPAAANGEGPADVHVAGGDHRGIVINKSSKTGEVRPPRRAWRDRRGFRRDVIIVVPSFERIWDFDISLRKTW